MVVRGAFCRPPSSPPAPLPPVPSSRLSPPPACPLLPSSPLPSPPFPRGENKANYNHIGQITTRWSKLQPQEQNKSQITTGDTKPGQISTGVYMCFLVYLPMCTCMCMYVSWYICIHCYIHMHMHVCFLVHLYAFHTHACVCMLFGMFVYILIYTCVCMYISWYICLRSYIHMHVYVRFLGKHVPLY